LDTVSDALTSAAVAAVGGVIYFAHGLYWFDPAVAIVIGVVVGAGAIGLLLEVVRELRTPPDRA